MPMMFFLFMLVLLGVVVTPIVIFTVMRVVPRIIDRTVPPLVDRITVSAAVSPELDARLIRIEEAIDAMAVEIDRMRMKELEASEPPQRLSPPHALDHRSRSHGE